MTNALLFISVLAFATVWVLLFLQWRQGRVEEDESVDDYTVDDKKNIVDSTLKQLNSHADWEEDDGDHVGRYDYQSGHFTLRISKGTPYVRLIYPFFFQAELEKIELVRSVCNDCNLNTETCCLVYSVNEKQGTVDVHIVNVVLLSEKTSKVILERAMKKSFYWQRTFVTRFSGLKEKSQRSFNLDLEKSSADHERELFLARELEMMHQEEGPEWHENSENPLFLRHLLAAAMGLSDIVPARMTITTDGETIVLEDTGSILDYDISSLLVADQNFKHLSAVVLLNYYDPRNPVRQRHLTMDFEQEGKTSKTLYYRVTLSLAPTATMPLHDTENTERRRLQTSVLIGHDLTPSDKQQEEFQYIWKEALAKQRSGHADDMTDDEKLLIRLQNPNYGWAVLHGKALYQQQRFYESLLILESVFDHLQRSFDKRGLSGQGIFFDVCHTIGSCYMRLHQYKRAAYYLQLTIPTRNLNYMETFVNCLVNGHDFRAMNFIDSFLHELMAVTGEEPTEQTSPELQEAVTFVAFLKRRKAYLLVQLERYDEAEKLLKHLLNDPESSDFALKELAYIQRKRGE